MFTIPRTKIPGHRLSQKVPARSSLPAAWDQWCFLARFDRPNPVIATPGRILTDGYLTVAGTPGHYMHGGFRSRTMSGTDGYHSVPASLLPANFPGLVDTDFTIMALFRIPDLSGTFKVIGQTALANANPSFFYVETDADFACLLDTGVGRTQAVGYTAGSWAVGGITYNASTDTVRFIYNGALVGSFASTTLALNPGEEFNITCRGTMNLPFIGQVAWVYLATRVIPDHVIRAMGREPMLFLMEPET